MKFTMVKDDNCVIVNPNDPQHTTVENDNCVIIDSNDFQYSEG